MRELCDTCKAYNNVLEPDGPDPNLGEEHVERYLAHIELTSVQIELVIKIINTRCYLVNHFLVETMTGAHSLRGRVLEDYIET